jgi:glyoxylase I family protein
LYASILTRPEGDCNGKSDRNRGPGADDNLQPLAIRSSSPYDSSDERLPSIEPAEGSEPHMMIEHVALNVTDPVAMAEWYTRHLGMRVLRRLTSAPLTHFLADESGQTVIEIYHQAKMAVPDYAAMDPMLLHIAFVAPNIHAERDRLMAAGAKPDGEVTPTPAGDQLAFLRDPWGVTIQLVKRAQPLREGSR